MPGIVSHIAQHPASKYMNGNSKYRAARLTTGASKISNLRALNDSASQSSWQCHCTTFATKCYIPETKAFFSRTKGS